MTGDAAPHRRDEYLTHRLQAFSDIVIGFSLAQLALSLVIPPHASDLWSHRAWLVAYLWTFIVIGAIWTGHTRLFRYVFVPTRVNVALNFTLLASLGLSVYFVQLYMRLTQHISDVIILGRSYFTVLAVMMLCFGTMYSISLRHNPEQLHPKEIEKALKTRLRQFSVGTGIMLGIALSFSVAKEFGMLAIVGGFVAGAVTARVLTKSTLAANRRALSRDMT